jgi:5-methylcytosine-specific restriction endonuclease McrA
VAFGVARFLIPLITKTESAFINVIINIELQSHSRKREQRAMKQSHRAVFKVDITKIEGDGDFPCPKCGVVISPDDKTDTVYKIIDTRVNNQKLEELVLLCNRCGSKIRLVGFLSLQK